MIGMEGNSATTIIQDGFGLVAANSAEAGVGSWTACKVTKISCTRYFSLRDTWTGLSCVFSASTLSGLGFLFFLEVPKATKP